MRQRKNILIRLKRHIRTELRDIYLLIYFLVIIKSFSPHYTVQVHLKDCIIILSNKIVTSILKRATVEFLADSFRQNYLPNHLYLSTTLYPFHHSKVLVKVYLNKEYFKF